MRVCWVVEDNLYSGPGGDKNRPHYIDVPDSKLEKCNTDEEKKSLINRCCLNDFGNQIWFLVDNSEPE